MDVTSPFFPAAYHLIARGSEPARTWSSGIYANLEGNGRPECADFARLTREWALEAVRGHAADPKGADDEHGGGEWFLAYLRAVHREIYDDIDRTDPGALLNKKYMHGLSDGRPRKHKIGDITVPSCADGFDTITRELNLDDKGDGDGPPQTVEEWIGREKIITNRSEVCAKILIDIWTSKLVDFSAALKIGEIVASEKRSRVTIVCYMGSVHTRALTEFFCDKMGFKRKAFVGQLDWEDENAPRTLRLPEYCWDLKKLIS